MKKIKEMFDEENIETLNREIDKLRLKKIKKGGIEALREHDEQLKKMNSDKMWEKGAEWMVKIIMIAFAISIIYVIISLF